MGERILSADCRTEMAKHGPFDMLVADPPYGDTSLKWDSHVEGWEVTAAQCLKPTGSLWVFGSMRFLMEIGPKMKAAGFRYAQDIVWEKHNGSGFQADRFKRVHEHVVQFYLADAAWSCVYNNVQTTPDAVARVVKQKKGRPVHMGNIEHSPYQSEDGGPRITRSVVFMKSAHGRAIHPTEKPDSLLEILILSSCPPAGLVGDMFAGSGAAGEAATRAGRRYIGFEIDENMAKKANARLSQSIFQPLAAS